MNNKQINKINKLLPDIYYLADKNITVAIDKAATMLFSHSGKIDGLNYIEDVPRSVYDMYHYVNKWFMECDCYVNDQYENIFNEYKYLNGLKIGKKDNRRIHCIMTEEQALKKFYCETDNFIHNYLLQNVPHIHIDKLKNGCEIAGLTGNIYPGFTMNYLKRHGRGSIVYLPMQDFNFSDYVCILPIVKYSERMV